MSGAYSRELARRGRKRNSSASCAAALSAQPRRRCSSRRWSQARSSLRLPAGPGCRRTSPRPRAPARAVANYYIRLRHKEQIIIERCFADIDLDVLTDCCSEYFLAIRFRSMLAVCCSRRIYCFGCSPTRICWFPQRLFQSDVVLLQVQLIHISTYLLLDQP